MRIIQSAWFLEPEGKTTFYLTTIFFNDSRGGIAFVVQVVDLPR